MHAIQTMAEICNLSTKTKEEANRLR